MLESQRYTYLNSTKNLYNIYVCMFLIYFFTGYLIKKHLRDYKGKVRRKSKVFQLM